MVAAAADAVRRGARVLLLTLVRRGLVVARGRAARREVAAEAGRCCWG